MKNSRANPYAQKDGSPIKGVEEQFFARARKKELILRKLLSSDDQRRLRETDRRMADKMNS